MLTIDDLTVRYRTPAGEIEALTSVSLAVAKGSTLALVGESGSGKSTVALAAMGLLPAEGRVARGRIRRLIDQRARFFDLGVGRTQLPIQFSAALIMADLFGRKPLRLARRIGGGGRMLGRIGAQGARLGVESLALAFRGRPGGLGFARTRFGAR